MEMPGKFSLQNKVILICLLSMVIPLMLVAGLLYPRSAELLERQVSQSNFSTVEQVADNIDMMFQDMKSTSVFLQQNREFMHYLRLSEEDIRRDLSNRLAMQNFINNYLAFNTNLHSIYLDAYNGLDFDSAGANNTLDAELMERLSKLRGGGILIPDVVTGYNGVPTKVFSYVKIVKDTDDLSSDLAILKINISQSAVSRIYSSEYMDKRSEYFIVDEQNKIIAGPDEDLVGTALSPDITGNRQFLNKNGHFTCKSNGREYVVSYFALPLPKWKLVNLIPLAELSQDMLAIRNVTVLAIVLSLLTCMLAISSFTVKALKPLRELRRAMIHLGDEYTGVNIDVKGHDEIALLADSFNKMSRKVSELINEVLAVQIKQKEAELQALHAQINPHFLYNTLEMIYWKCRMEKADESASLVQTLSRLFRLTLNSGNEFTSLRKEIEHIKLYMTIQQKRFDEEIRFIINAPDELLDCKVVKLILQPIVENAIIHGIEKNGGVGTVEVTISREGKTLVYQIRDDGAGAVESEVAAFLEKPVAGDRGFAINNVNERIKIYYGGDYGIAFRTAPGSGMTVTVTQPLPQEDTGNTDTWEQ